MPLRLEKRPDRKTWYIRGTIAGRPIRESTGLSRKSDAEQLLNARKRDLLDTIALGEGATYTFADAVLAYVEAGQSPRFLKKLVEHFGPDRKLRTINNRAAHAAAEALYPHAQWSTKNRQAITPIAAVYAHASLDEIVPPRVFRKIPAPKGAGRRMRWLEPSEAERLIECADRLAPMILFLLGTGCRAGELLRLQSERLNMSSAQAFIAETKTGAPRWVNMPARTSAAIAEMLAERSCKADNLIERATRLEQRNARTDDQRDQDLERAGVLRSQANALTTGAVFRSPKGAAYTVRAHSGGQMAGAFNRARDLAGLGADVTPHVLRHTWATWFSAQTGDFGELMDLGGWKKADMAMHYRKAAPDDLGDRLLDFGWDFRKEARQIRETRPPLHIAQRA